MMMWFCLGDVSLIHSISLFLLNIPIGHSCPSFLCFIEMILFLMVVVWMSCVLCLMFPHKIVEWTDESLQEINHNTHEHAFVLVVEGCEKEMSHPDSCLPSFLCCQNESSFVFWRCYVLVDASSLLHFSSNQSFFFQVPSHNNHITKFQNDEGIEMEGMFN